MDIQIPLQLVRKLTKLSQLIKNFNLNTLCVQFISQNKLELIMEWLFYKFLPAVRNC